MRYFLREIYTDTYNIHITYILIWIFYLEIKNYDIKEIMNVYGKVEKIRISFWLVFLSVRAIYT